MYNFFASERNGENQLSLQKNARFMFLSISEVLITPKK